MTNATYQFLDLTQAKDIAREPEQLRQLVATFHTSLSDEISKIKQALSAQDQAALAFSLHTLKGFMAIFVAPTLALQVEVLYKNCRTQPLAATATEFNALVPNFEALMGEVRTWLSL